MTNNKRCIICGFDVDEHRDSQVYACYKEYERKFPLQDSGDVK